jgi:hypothetical protein
MTPGEEAVAYSTQLRQAAQCTNGLVTIVDVEMSQPDKRGRCRLHFRCNGRPCSWHVYLRGEHFDLMAFTENIDDLNAPPRLWDSIDVDESGDCDPDDLELRNFYFSGKPAALRQLAFDFGVKLLRLDN